MDSNSEQIIKKHEEENRRSAMAKRMAEEEQRRRDINVQHWDGIQSNKTYMFSLGSGKWSQMSVGGKVFFIMGIIATVLVVALLIFTAIKAFSTTPIVYN
ncbi:MAG: hypothetical protein KAH14_00530 [Clostridiales bacterium]|nr:hypothetical protein [Clostridiales bacterium]